VLLLLVSLLFAAGCTPEYGEANFEVVGGVGELQVIGAFANADARVVDAQGNTVVRGETDGDGNWQVSVPPGQGYRVRVSSDVRREESEPVEVFALASFSVRAGIEQIYVTNAATGSELEVRDGQGALVDQGTVDAQGAWVARQLGAAANAYRVIDRVAGEASADVDVTSIEDSLPDPSFYSDQVLTPGFTYITMRDGTTLSAYITVPAGPGPHPTLVSYSGYAPSRPGRPLGVGALLEAFLCPSLPVICDAPNHPAGVIGGLFDFATVGVNMRGTGCSGGAYDFFEPLQILDGYDIVEAVAAQDWVLHNHVGMTGISFPGISQLFTAQTRPPSLAAIAPLSVIANTAASTLAPGGIFNDGFAFQWAEAVFDNAAPYGQGWEQAQVDVEAAEGKDTCAQNQILHGQAVDPIERAQENDYYVPEIADPLNPSLFVQQIDVPVFLTGAWQDEQTGPHFATLLDDFTSAPVQRFTVFNGLHADGYSPDTLAEWKAFHDIYVAEQAPTPPPFYTLVAPTLFDGAFGQELAPSPIPFSNPALYPTVEAARAAFEAQPRLKVIFERGGHSARLGMPTDGFARNFSEWPPVETTPWRLHLHADGSLREGAPAVADDSSSKFEHDPAAGERTLGGGQPFYDWAQPEAGKALVFVSDPLTSDHVLVGSGSVDLWLSSTADDADIEVLISEVRPDGNEVYLQGGWLRASQRALAPDATELRPVKTHLEGDAALLPPGQPTLTRVEIMPFAQALRPGSRVRLEISTPGDSRELWKFLLLDYPPGELVEHQVEHSAAYPSSVVLPLIPGATPPMFRPVCPSQRGQPCRPHVGYVNAVGD